MNEIIFGEDNTAAKANLISLYCAKDQAQCGRLFGLWNDLNGITLRAIYINTERMPADAPSRYTIRQFMTKEWHALCDACVVELREAAEKHSEVKEVKDSRGKRNR
jgi:hypothetical protein